MAGASVGRAGNGFGSNLITGKLINISPWVRAIKGKPLLALSPRPMGDGAALRPEPSCSARWMPCYIKRVRPADGRAVQTASRHSAHLFFDEFAALAHRFLATKALAVIALLRYVGVTIKPGKSDVGLEVEFLRFRGCSCHTGRQLSDARCATTGTGETRHLGRADS